jgi:hypothetical protein
MIQKQLIVEWFGLHVPIAVKRLSIQLILSAGSKVVVLPEDVELAGFVPLLSMSYSPTFTGSDTDVVSSFCIFEL